MTVHRHAWSVVGFGIESDRPLMRQRCDCGAERTVPAWDRSWVPPLAWRVATVAGPLRGRLLERHAPDRSLVMADAIRVDVWSDVACPWCYIGKRNLEAGMAAFAERRDTAAVAVEYHSFELAPDTPVDFAGSELDYLAEIKGISREQAQMMLDRVTGIAAGVGLSYDFGAVRHTRTLKAHQLVHHAKARGLQAEAMERLYRAYFVEGRHIGQIGTLSILAAEIGLDGDEVAQALEADAHLEAVHDDQRWAAALGIRGVPFFVLDGRYALSGAQPAETFAAALGQVDDERAGQVATPPVG